MPELEPNVVVDVGRNERRDRCMVGGETKLEVRKVVIEQQIFLKRRPLECRRRSPKESEVRLIVARRPLFREEKRRRISHLGKKQGRRDSASGYLLGAVLVGSVLVGTHRIRTSRVGREFP